VGRGLCGGGIESKLLNTICVGKACVSNPPSKFCSCTRVECSMCGCSRSVSLLSVSMLISSKVKESRRRVTFIGTWFSMENGTPPRPTAPIVAV
jgi:hypothetical protein